MTEQHSLEGTRHQHAFYASFTLGILCSCSIPTYLFLSVEQRIDSQVVDVAVGIGLAKLNP